MRQNTYVTLPQPRDDVWITHTIHERAVIRQVEPDIARICEIRQNNRWRLWRWIVINWGDHHWAVNPRRFTRLRLPASEPSNVLSQAEWERQYQMHYRTFMDDPEEIDSDFWHYIADKDVFHAQVAYGMFDGETIDG